MAQGKAKYPVSAWDGSSPSRVSPVSGIDRPPDTPDWDQITAEMKAVQTDLLTSSWTALTPANTWTNKAGYAAAGFRTRGNEVLMRGVLAAGTLTDGTTVVTLPAGSRPTTALVFPTCPASGDTGDANMLVKVGTDGTVKVYGLTLAASISLGGIRFFTDQ